MRKIEIPGHSRKIKNLGFPMFNCITKLIEKGSNDVVAIQEWSVWFFKGFLLWNKKTVIYKR